MNIDLRLIPVFSLAFMIGSHKAAVRKQSVAPEHAVIE